MLSDAEQGQELADFEAWDRQRERRRRQKFLRAINDAEKQVGPIEFTESCRAFLAKTGILTVAQVEALERIANPPEEEDSWVFGYGYGDEWWKDEF